MKQNIKAKSSITMSGEILLYGVIGEVSEGLDANSILAEIDTIQENNITLRIHSAGGYITEGLAIYNRLKGSGKHLTIHIDGIAASMASVVAMAGNHVTMPENAWIMIHKPWNQVSGNAEEMREVADSLDRFEETLINIYREKTKLSKAKLKEMLAKETWLNAEQALELGFIDHVSEPMQHAAKLDISNFTSPPKPELTQLFMKGTDMKNKATSSTVEAQNAALQKNNTDIKALVSLAKLDDEFADQLIAKGIQLEDARNLVIDAVAARDEKNVPTGHVVIGAEYDITGSSNSEIGRWDAYSEALACRNTNMQPSQQARSHMGMTMTDMARSMLEATGYRTTGLSGHSIVAKALTTSDFPAILGDAGQRILNNSYRNVPSTMKRIASQNYARDFRSLTRVGLSEAPELLKVNESGEFKTGSMGESKETYSLETFGRIFGLSRQAIINDDLGAFSDMSGHMARAAAEFESKFLLSKITSNPVMSDGKTLFHASHGNLGTTSALSLTSLTEARKKMRLQKGMDGKTPVDAQPTFLLVPAALEGLAEQLMTTIYANSVGDSNPYAGSLQILVEPRLDAISDTQWYLFSDPALLKVLEYAYLENEAGPVFESRVGFETDDVQFKVRLDIGAGILDHRGAFFNAGA